MPETLDGDTRNLENEKKRWEKITRFLRTKHTGEISMKFGLTPNEAKKIKAKYPPSPDYTEGSPYSYTNVRWYWNEKGISWPVKERILYIPTRFEDTICELVEVIEGGERFPNLERLRLEKRSFSKNK